MGLFSNFFVVLFVFPFNEADFVFEDNYKSCILTKVTMVHRRNKLVARKMDFQFSDQVYNATYSTDALVFYKLCGPNEKEIPTCPRNSVGCLIDQEKTINFGNRFEFDNTTHYKLSTVNGERCSPSQNYSLTIALYCPDHFKSDPAAVSKSGPCQYETKLLDPNCDIPCTARIEGQFLDLTPLKRSYCIEPEPNKTYCLSLCDVNSNCVQKSNLKKIANGELNACEIENNRVTQAISLNSTIKAYYNGEENELAFHGTLHEKMQSKVINNLKVKLRCNWNKKESNDTDLHYIRKMKQGKNFDFELETSYGCVKRPSSCLITEDNLVYNLTGLYSVHREGWKVNNISNSMILNICGPLNLSSQYKECSATHSQVCETIGERHVSKGSVLRPLEVDNDVIYTRIENGSQCELNLHTQYTTFIKFYCDRIEHGPYFYKEDNCSTFIYWKTPYACPEFNVSHCDANLTQPFHCNIFQNGSDFGLDLIKEQKVVENGTNTFYLNFCGLASIKEAPCLKDASIVMVNSSEFNKKHRVHALGKFVEAEMGNHFLVLKYTNGHYCDLGQDYSTSVRFLCSKTNGNLYLVNETKCFFEFEWETPYACINNSKSIPSRDCRFKDVNKNQTFDFNSIQTEFHVKNVNLTYTFDICQENYTVCSKNTDCSSKLLQSKPVLVTNDNATSVMLHLPNNCQKSDEFNIVNFELVCDWIKRNEHIQFYKTNDCVLDVSYATRVVCLEPPKTLYIKNNCSSPDSQDPKLCDNDIVPQQASNSGLKIGLGVSGGILLLAVIAVLIYLFLRRRLEYRCISSNPIYVKDTDL